MKNPANKFRFEVIKMFCDCLIWKPTDDLKYDQILEGKTRKSNKVYYFYKDKIKKYSKQLCEMYDLIDNSLSNDLSFDDLKHLKIGSDWTRMNQHIEFFTSLLYANESLIYKEEDIANPTILATSMPELKLIDTKKVR